MKKILKFPEGFLWGASSASHQVEGNTVNDWTEWEKSHERVEDLHRQGLVHTHGLENFITNDGADHYNMFREDFRLAKGLGHNATRISIEWSRIELREGVFDEKEIAHYKEVISTLRELGLEPFVTLWHWPIPLWLRDKGGWESKEVVFYFKRYAEKVVSAFGKDVTFWLTLNEPEVYSPMSYLSGIWPPQKKNPLSFLKVLVHLIKAHNETYPIIKKINPESKVSIAFNLESFEAVNFVDRFFVKIYSWFRNEVLIWKTKKNLDFIGLNYYFHSRVHFGMKRNKAEKFSDLNWHLRPEKIYDMLMVLKKYNKPVYITENGLADSTDKHRWWFIHESVRAIHKSIEEGVDVKGYLHWSLTDNFEWHHGFWPRFGLIKIDYKTLKREIRPSARYYEKICKTNTIEVEE